MPKMHFIDVSHWQGKINFQAVAADGCLGVIAKCTEGTGYVDELYTANRSDALAAGLAFASYHYLLPGDAEEQMNYYLAMAGPRPGERIVLDYEETGPAVTIDDLKAAVGYIKTNRPDLQITVYGASKLTDDVNACDNVGWLADTSLWAARYSSNPPIIGDAWDSWSAWQYSDCGEVDGINGDVDLNTFNGSAENCLAWFGPVGVPVPLPPEPDMPLVIVNIQAPTDINVVVHVNGEPYTTRRVR